MSRRKRSRSAQNGKRSPTGDYAVGYCKPPAHGQFKPGQSGFPTGRPKGAKNEDTIVREVMSRRVALSLGGKVRKVSLLEAVWTKIADDALKGNAKAQTLFTNRARSLGENGPDTSATLSPDDEQVLASYHRQVEADIRVKDKAK